MAAYLKAYPRNQHYVLVSLAPPLALAQAHLGDFAAAERSIALTPDDCYPCLSVRAQIAELHGQHARADFWFARAGQAEPRLSLSPCRTGAARCWRAASRMPPSRKFTLANQKARTSPIRWKAGARR